MRYIETTVDTLHKGQHVEAGTILAFEDDDGAIGNYLASKRGVEVDAKAYEASRRRPRGSAASAGDGAGA